MTEIKVAVLQTKVHADKNKNLDAAVKYIETVSKEKVDLVTLPEMFNCPYRAKNFPVYAEPEGGETWCALSALAKQHKIYLSAGTIPESDEAGRTYNTAYVFDREGNQIAKHRKMHLFDIDVEGGQYFKESETLTAGNEVTVFNTEFGGIGICICYDMRFPELSRLMALKGARIILVPGAFNMTTGPAHWELMFRSRAIDNQVYTVGTSPARDTTSTYISWGHSMIASPWGEVVKQLDEKEGYIIQSIDLSRVEQIRRELPLLAHRRTDIYDFKIL